MSKFCDNKYTQSSYPLIFNGIDYLHIAIIYIQNYMYVQKYKNLYHQQTLKLWRSWTYKVAGFSLIALFTRILKVTVFVSGTLEVFTVVAKVIFLHLFVILFTGGVSASVHAEIPHPPPGSRHALPPEQTPRHPPGNRHTPPGVDSPQE